jgi:hypothetical protein
MPRVATLTRSARWRSKTYSAAAWRLTALDPGIAVVGTITLSVEPALLLAVRPS